MKPETDSDWIHLLRETSEAERQANKRSELAREREVTATRAHEDAKQVANAAQRASYEVMSKFRAWLGEA